MDVAIFGIIASFATVCISIWIGGDLSTFANLPSFFIVVVGTFTCTCTQYSPRLIGSVLKRTFQSKKGVIDENALTEQLIEIAYFARREGILSLEQRVKDLDNEYLGKGFRLVIDGLDPETIRDVLDTEISNLQSRHDLGAQVMEVMAGFCPALGMMGTVVGLVQMLNTMSDPSTIGPAMAVALITTFYGTVGANFIFAPLAGRLRTISAAEVRLMEMGQEGIVAVAKGENPRILREKLDSYLHSSKRPKNEQ